MMGRTPGATNKPLIERILSQLPKLNKTELRIVKDQVEYFLKVKDKIVDDEED